MALWISREMSGSTRSVGSGCGAAAPGSTGCPTSFPSGPGMGASFDRELWELIGDTIGREARALNNQAIPSDRDDGTTGTVPGLPPNGKSGIYFLDPNINLMRDPRWPSAAQCSAVQCSVGGLYGHCHHHSHDHLISSACSGGEGRRRCLVNARCLARSTRHILSAAPRMEQRARLATTDSCGRPLPPSTSRCTVSTVYEYSTRRRAQPRELIRCAARHGGLHPTDRPNATPPIRQLRHRGWVPALEFRCQPSAERFRR